MRRPKVSFFATADSTSSLSADSSVAVKDPATLSSSSF